MVDPILGATLGATLGRVGPKISAQILGAFLSKLGWSPRTRNIYIYAVELKTGPRFGVSSVKNWSKSSVKNWSKFFFAVFSPVLKCFLGIFRNTNSATVCQNSVFAKFWECQK